MNVIRCYYRINTSFRRVWIICVLCEQQVSQVVNFILYIYRSQMEYLGMFATYFGTSLVTTRLLLKQDEIANLGKTFAQAGIIAMGMVIFTLLLNMLRAYRVCEAKGDQKKSTGLSSGLILSVWACFFGLTIFVLMNMITPITSVITAILPFLKDYIGVVIGLGVAIFGLIGYWFGRIFTSLC